MEKSIIEIQLRDDWPSVKYTGSVAKINGVATPNGKGEWIFKTGDENAKYSKFIGNFVEGLENGEGVLYSGNRLWFSRWRDGRIHGPVLLTVFYDDGKPAWVLCGQAKNGMLTGKTKVVCDREPSVVYTMKLKPDQEHGAISRGPIVRIDGKTKTVCSDHIFGLDVGLLKIESITGNSCMLVAV